MQRLRLHACESVMREAVTSGTRPCGCLWWMVLRVGGSGILALKKEARTHARTHQTHAHQLDVGRFLVHKDCHSWELAGHCILRESCFLREHGFGVCELRKRTASPPFPSDSRLLLAALRGSEDVKYQSVLSLEVWEPGSLRPGPVKQKLCAPS